MKNISILLGIVLLSVNIFAQATVSNEVPTSTPAQLFHKAPKQKYYNPELGFQANIDFEGTFSRMLGIRITDGTQLVDAEPFSVGGICMGGGVGLRYREFLYVGAAFNFFGDWGTQYFYSSEDFLRQCSNKYSIWTMPIYANFRLLMPTESSCFPYLDLGIGGYVGIAGKVTRDMTSWNEPIKTLDALPDGGFYFTIGLGAEFRYINIGIGYKYFDKLYITNYYNYSHYGYVRVGVSLGRPAQIK